MQKKKVIKKAYQKAPSSLFANGVMCVLISVYCWFNAASLWKYALIFTAVSVADFVLWIKQKRRSEQAQSVIEEFYDDEEKESHSEEKENLNKQKDKREQEYKKYLDDIEKEFESLYFDEDEE